MTRYWYPVLVFFTLAWLAALCTSSAGCMPDPSGLPMGGQYWDVEGVGRVRILHGCEHTVDWGLSTVEYSDGIHTYRSSCRVFTANATLVVPETTPEVSP